MFTLDGMSRDVTPGQEVQRSDFDYMGSRVTEIRSTNGEHTYLGWVKAPLESLITDGFVNPIFHTSFLTGDYEGEENARAYLREQYNKYYEKPARTIAEFEKLRR